MLKRFIPPSLLLCLLLMAPLHLFAGDFKPVSQEELSMKDNPKEPGAHAMILEWDDNEDDANSTSVQYYRIKIFSDEGKKYGDVEIPYWQGSFFISDLKARTIHPDGTIIPFTGKIYDKVVVKSRGYKMQAKTFSLPDVQPGSVIEYRYRKGWDPSLLYPTNWELQQDLFIKHASFTLKPYTNGNYGTRWISIGLPNGAKVKDNHDSYSLELDNIPAFDKERDAPPDRELKPRVQFFYTQDYDKDADTFWKRIGKEGYHEAEDFIGNKKEVAAAASQALVASDAPEVKLQKLYARAQQVRNLSYENSKTAEEEKRDKLKLNKNSADVLRNGFGYHNDINRLFAGMARAAGFQASILKVSERDQVFFRKTLLDADQLNGEIVHVRDAGKDWYLDPGTPLCPFGLLPWKVTGVQALEVAKDGGSFVTTPQPDVKLAVTQRLAQLKFDEGGFKGTVQVVFRDQEALVWRLSEFTSDESEVRKDMEDELKSWLPGGSTVSVTGIQNIKDSSKPLIVNYDVELPMFGSLVGSRVLLPMEVFEYNNANPFQHEKRVHPVYFEYPYQQLDKIIIEMPKEFNVESLPSPKKEQTGFGYYDSNWENAGNTFVMQRRFAVLGFYLPQKFYPDLRTFFGKVNANDQESVVVRPNAATNSISQN